MKAFLLDDYYIVVDRHYYNIKRVFNIKIIWILIREKPVPLYCVVLWDIVNLFKLFKTILLIPVPWLTRSLFCFVFPKLLGVQFCRGSQVVGIYRYLKSWSRRLQDHIAIVYFHCVVSAVLWKWCIFKYKVIFQSYVIYYMLFVPLWDSCYSDVVFFFFFYSKFLSYLSLPSNFFH